MAKRRVAYEGFLCDRFGSRFGLSFGPHKSAVALYLPAERSTYLYYRHVGK